MMHVDVIAAKDYLGAGVANDAEGLGAALGNERHRQGLIFYLHVQPLAANPERRPTAWHSPLLEIARTARMSHIGMARLEITKSFHVVQRRRRLVYHLGANQSRAHQQGGD